MSILDQPFIHWYGTKPLECPHCRMTWYRQELPHFQCCQTPEQAAACQVKAHIEWGKGGVMKIEGQEP